MDGSAPDAPGHLSFVNMATALMKHSPPTQTKNDTQKFLLSTIENIILRFNNDAEI